MQREWFPVAVERGLTASEHDRARIERAATTIHWHTYTAELTGPMAPVLLLREILPQLGTEKTATHVGWSGEPLEYPEYPGADETATHSLVAVRWPIPASGCQELFLLDIGTGAVPVFLDTHRAAGAEH